MDEDQAKQTTLQPTTEELVEAVSTEPQTTPKTEQEVVPEIENRQATIPETEPIPLPEPVVTTVPTPPEPTIPSSSSPESTVELEQSEVIPEANAPGPNPISEPKIDTPIPELITPKPVEQETPKEPSKVIQPEPIKSTPPEVSRDNTEFDVANLTDEQLKSAAALWAKKNQKVISQAGVAKRQETSRKNIAEVTKFVNGHSPASNATIARALNLPPKTVQYYMQMLTKNGTVTATGWGASRRYFKK